MAFLFKSKKNQDRALQSRDGTPGPAVGAAGRMAHAEKNGSRSTPTGSLNSFDENSPTQDPEKHAMRQHQQQYQQQHNEAPVRHPVYDVSRNGSQQSQTQSLYPWSQQRLTFTSQMPSPFPRYGAAVNPVSSKEGDIYVMGGLINSQTVKGDLWMIEAGGNMACYPLLTTAEGPGPRVGHAALLVGNAYIIYGGDTKIEENDVLDETLYLLNTSTRQWSRALPSGPRPSGRYGHSLNIIGSKIYIFGGQVEGYFMNDLAAFDLNQLQAPNNRWEILFENTEASPASQGKVPPARTNHSMVTYQDKLYLFGGTNGFQWFNDVWCYDPVVNAWSQLDCIGYIPVPREGHAASLVGDVMYVFGGRTEEGSDLGDLAAFRISSRRWYTFQNMGPTPSARSGHSMTAVGKSIVVVGGEPSVQANGVNDLSLVYILDTTKIRYPNDAQIQSSTQKMQQTNQPGNGRPREGSAGPPDQKRLQNGPTSPTSRGPMGGPLGGPPPGPAPANPGSKLPRAAGAGTPSGPPPQGQLPRPNVQTNGPNARARNASIERIEREHGGSASPSLSSQTQSPIREVFKEEAPMTNGRRTPNHQANRSGSQSEAAPFDAARTQSGRHSRGQASVDSNVERSQKSASHRPSSPPPPTRSASNPLARRSSLRNSQTVALLKELDASRNRNAWYASELELARKSGYAPSAAMSPTLESRAETFDDEDRPLIEALLAMRQELANVQSSVDKQAATAAKQVAEAERQRDAAIQEAVYAKAKLAAHSGGTLQPETDRDADGGDRVHEINRKLAAALSLQQDLQDQLSRTTSDLEGEKRARQLADDTSKATQKRMAELESYKQQTSIEIESLRAELHNAQREAREQATASAEANGILETIRIEQKELQSKYDDAIGNRDEHGATMEALQKAMAASEDTRTHLQQKLDAERTMREQIEADLTKLKAEHEARTAELVAASQRLRDAEELAAKNAKEAETHRQAVLSGLDKITHDGSKEKSIDSDRILALQGQVNAANNLVRRYQEEANVASDKLRSAEERIAGLEAYQEQSSREGVTIRRQLQAAMKETQSLQAANSDLKHQLANQQLETNAITVQHNTLKEILTERNISPTARARAMTGGSRNGSPAGGDLEQQLAEAKAAIQETKQTYETQSQQAEASYREKISQLENDYQSAVHYVKGTEKMLKRMKEELSKYQAENTRLKSENLELEEKATNTAAPHDEPVPADWETQRESLQKKVEELEGQLKESSSKLDTQLAEIRKELDGAQTERDSAKKSNEEAMQRLDTNQKELEEMQQENAVLLKRAQDAEQKVSMLLDQVESSVDNYRRRSRQITDLVGSPKINIGSPPSTNGGTGHQRQESSEAGSLYGGLGEARNSAALDNLADELDQLRTKWEATNDHYRLSNAFDFETSKKDEEGGSLGLTESLSDWRKRLDSEEQQAKAEGPKSP